jgi:ethanolamine kinase
LCGNIIIGIDDKAALGSADQLGERKRMSSDQIHFIDYEFAMHCPAAFDIANHFSEWCGFHCDYESLPSRLVRKRFIDRYLLSYMQHANITSPGFASLANRVATEVDLFRGIPGLWWGIHGLVSVLESKVDFDWIPYTDKRLAEYWGWKAEVDGSRLQKGEEMTLREKMWARD